MFMSMNYENFMPDDLMKIKEKLEKMDDDKIFLFQSIKFRKPSTILILAILGIERFWLDDILLGILKIILSLGIVGLIWWFLDIFSAKKRAKRHNFKKFTQAISFL